MIFVKSTTIEFIWKALNEKPMRAKFIEVDKIFERLAKLGWACRADIEDIIYFLDPRLSTQELDIEELSKAIGQHWETIYYKPKARSNSVSGYKGLSVENVACLLMRIERLGFFTDANLLVKRLLPQVKAKKQYFSKQELEIFWFEKRQHRNEEFTLTTSEWNGNVKEEKNIKTSSNYKVKLQINCDNTPGFLSVTAPKYRQPQYPTKTTCIKCNVVWFKGDPDSSASHRQQHKRRMAYLDPQPLIEFTQNKFADNDPELVTAFSPKWKHKEIYERALAFKRELRFDFIQWRSPNGDNDPNVHGFIFADENDAIVGACAFRKRGDFWGLQWVWICPKARRQGVLTQRWGHFKERFGDFIVEGPVSNEMKLFLKKKSDLHLMTHPTERIRNKSVGDG